VATNSGKIFGKMKRRCVDDADDHARRRARPPPSVPGAPPFLGVLGADERTAGIYPRLDTPSLGALACACRGLAGETYLARLARPHVRHRSLAVAFRNGERHAAWIRARFLTKIGHTLDELVSAAVRETLQPRLKYPRAARHLRAWLLRTYQPALDQTPFGSWDSVVRELILAGHVPDLATLLLEHRVPITRNAIPWVLAQRYDDVTIWQWHCIVMAMGAVQLAAPAAAAEAAPDAFDEWVEPDSD
jgi:hypothetical protein